MPRRLYRKALALAACLWALPAAAKTPAAQTTGTAAQSAQAAGGLGALGTAGGGAVLIGTGAYSYVRRHRQEERDRRRAKQRTPVYFENHTRNGTLRPEAQNHLE